MRTHNTYRKSNVPDKTDVRGRACNMHKQVLYIMFLLGIVRMSYVYSLQGKVLIACTYDMFFQKNWGSDLGFYEGYYKYTVQHPRIVTNKKNGAW